MTLLEAAKQALDALLDSQQVMIGEFSDLDAYAEEIQALRQAIEQAEKQEPFGWVMGMGGNKYYFSTEPPEGGVFGTITRVYKSPPQRPWVGLTDQEIMQALEKANLPTQFSYRMAGKAIEAKLKEKNS